MVHLADIKFGDLGANTSWLTFSLANQLSIVRYTAAGSEVDGDFNLTILVEDAKLKSPPNVPRIRYIGISYSR